MNEKGSRRKVGDRHPPALLMNNRLRGLLERRNRFDYLLKNGNTVADLGSGSGYYALHFSEVLGPGGLVYAVDTNRGAIEALDRKIKEGGIKNIVTSTSSTAKLDFIPDSTVDFVLSNLTLCCMAEHEAAVDEMMRIMKQGARAYVSINTIGRKSDPRWLSRKEFGGFMERFGQLDKIHRRTVSAVLVEKK